MHRFLRLICLLSKYMRDLTAKDNIVIKHRTTVKVMQIHKLTCLPTPASLVPGDS
jgi:hypothetical protein